MIIFDCNSRFCKIPIKESRPLTASSTLSWPSNVILVTLCVKAFGPGCHMIHNINQFLAKQLIRLIIL